MLKSG
jgi:hypothetical protein